MGGGPGPGREGVSVPAGLSWEAAQGHRVGLQRFQGPVREGLDLLSAPGKGSLKPDAFSQGIREWERAGMGDEEHASGS